jgi:hypothetical protein
MVYTQNPLIKRLRGGLGLFLAICGIFFRKIFQPNGLRDCPCARAIKPWSLPRYDCAGFGGNVLQRAASKMLKRIREFAAPVARGGELAGSWNVSLNPGFLKAMEPGHAGVYN